MRFNEGLKYIGKSAISNNDNLTDLYLPSTVEDVSGTTNFGSQSDILRIHVPAGSAAESLVTDAVKDADCNIEVIAE